MCSSDLERERHIHEPDSRQQGKESVTCPFLCRERDRASEREREREREREGGRERERERERGRERERARKKGRKREKERERERPDWGQQRNESVLWARHQSLPCLRSLLRLVRVYICQTDLPKCFQKDLSTCVVPRVSLQAVCEEGSNFPTHVSLALLAPLLFWACVWGWRGSKK